MIERPPEDEDADLIPRAQSGDDEAIDILFSRFKPMVRSRAASMYIAGSDHEDVVQEGMIGLFKAMRDFRPERGASFRTFAAQCVTAQITDAVRAALREKHRPLNDSLSLQGLPDREGEGPVSLLDLYADSSAEDPERRLISAESTRAIEEFIETELTVLERSAIRLLMTRSSYRKAAAVLGRDTKAVDNAVRRARRKFALRFREPSALE
jgi:RNA polymerase sporulation-specific sigma factor